METAEKKQVKRYMWILAGVYMASYLMRYSYSTVLAEMVKATEHTKAELSLAVTGLFICYGIGQPISGLLGDRLSPKKMVLAGLLGSGAINLLLPFVSSIPAWTALWCVNGFLQSMFWPPVVAIMTRVFNEIDYARATVRVAFGGSFGTILLYLVAPLLIKLFSWKSVFIFAGVTGLLFFPLFLLSFPEISPVPKAEDTKAPQPAKVPLISLITPGFIMLALMIATHGFIKDGINTWMPTFISELFKLSSESSILTGVMLPIFSILCFKFGEVLERRLKRGPIFCAGLFFAAGCLFAFLLTLLNGRLPGLTALSSALLAGTMNGVNLMLVCLLPAMYKNTGHVSTVSGILNAFTYAGSSAAAYALAAMSEHLGWQKVFLVLGIIAAVSAAVCILLRNFKPVKERPAGAGH